MTTTPQEPGEQEDPQTHVDSPPDRVPSSEETVSGDNDPEASAPERAPDPGDTEQDLPGIDPSWRQHAQAPAEGPDDPDLPT
jgi:hypothetical protein